MRCKLKPGGEPVRPITININLNVNRTSGRNCRKCRKARVKTFTEYLEKKRKKRKLDGERIRNLNFGDDL